MQKKLALINLGLTLAIMALAAFAADIWLNPKFPGKVDPKSLDPLPRSLESVAINRKPHNPQITTGVMNQNLFRQQRSEYVPPPPPVQAPAPSAPAPVATVAALPPPKVSLNGIFMANGTKVAFLNGEYPVRAGGNKVEDKKLKRKGYYLGDSIGDYRIQEIQKDQVVMKNNQGGILTVGMPKRSAKQEIKRNGNHFSHKDKSARLGNQVEVEKIIKVNPRAPKPRTPPRRRTVTPQRTQTKPNPAPAPAQRQVQPVPQPRAAISGAVTRPRVIRPHISGR